MDINMTLIGQSIASSNGGQMNFMQNQKNTLIEIDWPMRVILMSTGFS